MYDSQTASGSAHVGRGPAKRLNVLPEDPNVLSPLM